MILRHHGGAALPSSSVNTWHDRKATQTAGKRAYRPQGGQPDPRWRDAVYRYRHHAGSGARALLDHNDAHRHQQPERGNTLMVKEDFRIILAGGELRSRDGGIIGEATAGFYLQFRLTSAFSASAASTATARCWSLITMKCAPSARLLKTLAT
jgi:DeoR family glycerol-3-phosphate regulon repressor